MNISIIMTRDSVSYVKHYNINGYSYQLMMEILSDTGDYNTDTEFSDSGYPSLLLTIKSPGCGLCGIIIVFRECVLGVKWIEFVRSI